MMPCRMYFCYKSSFLGILNEQLSKNDLCHINFKDLFSSFTPLVEKKCMSTTSARKLAQQGIGFYHLKIAQKRDSSSGVEIILRGASLSKKAASNICQYLDLVDCLAGVAYRGFEITSDERGNRTWVTGDGSFISNQERFISFCRLREI